jgi:hypothetical protein
MTSCISQNNIITLDKTIIKESEIDKRYAQLYDKESDISIKANILNDSLIISLASNRESSLRKIYNLGLSVSIKKGRNKLQINYPLSQDQKLNREEFSKLMQNSNRNELSSEYKNRFNKYELIEYPQRILEEYSILEKSKLKLNLYHTSFNIFNYKLKIPLDKFTGRLEVSFFNTFTTDDIYDSSLSNKEFVQKKLQSLEAGNQNQKEYIEEFNFQIQIAE